MVSLSKSPAASRATTPTLAAKAEKPEKPEKAERAEKAEKAEKATSATKPTAPPSTLVLLVRHGQTPTTGIKLPGRAKGLHLSDVGKTQAETVAVQLDSVSKIDAIYASPLERARETAQPLAKRRGLSITIDRGLFECDFGDWTGADLKDLYKKPEWTTVQRYPSGFRFPNGESFSEMQTRIVSAIGRLVAAHPGGTIALVSHADPIKAAVADALGTHLDLFQRISISTCSVTAISYSSAGPSVLAVNTTSDLGKLKPS
jgi:probable phosphomutase (TIGR03848 family)